MKLFLVSNKGLFTRPISGCNLALRFLVLKACLSPRILRFRGPGQASKLEKCVVKVHAEIGRVI
jgi:hypothetical protein